MPVQTVTTHPNMQADFFGLPNLPQYTAAASRQKGTRKSPLALSVEQRRQRRLARTSSNHQTGFDAFDAELHGTTLTELANGVTRYASGVLSPAYWRAYQAADRPLCVAATELTEATLARVCNLVAGGGTVLVDSGAFVYRDRFSAMPWGTVREVYQRIANAASDEATLTFILPDAVGSQSDSLDALKHWGTRLMDTVGPRHEVLLPVQRGADQPSTFIDKAMAILKRPIGGIAIPCKAKAFPAEHLADLANVARPDVPKRVHFLGISGDRKKLEGYALHLQRAWPGAQASCDAVEHRCHVGQGETLTEMRHEILDGPITDATLNTYDATDTLINDADMTEQVRTRLAVKYAWQLEAEESEDDRNELLDSLMLSAEADTIEHQIKIEQTKRHYGSWATAAAANAIARGIEPKILTSYWTQQPETKP